MDGTLPALFRADPVGPAAAPWQEEGSVQEEETGAEELEEGQTGPSGWPSQGLEAGGEAP